MTQKNTIVEESVAAVIDVTGKDVAANIRGAFIFGSGLSPSKSTIKPVSSIDYERIPCLQAPSVLGHGGRLQVFERSTGYMLGFAGRSHFYEGLPASDLGNAVRLSHGLGAGFICSFAAVGSLHSEIEPGTLVSITDHINMTGASPLTITGEGSVDFPSMLELYNHNERSAVKEKLSHVEEGVYAWMRGPQYETPAESRMLQMLGADVVGMSLVPEMITAASLGLKAFGFACVTNHAPGIGAVEASHIVVIKNAAEFDTKVLAAVQAVVEVMR